MVVIPIVLINTPAIFMQTMNNLFLNILDKEKVGFLDAVLIFSTMVEEYFELLEKVFI